MGQSQVGTELRTGFLETRVHLVADVHWLSRESTDIDSCNLHDRGTYILSLHPFCTFTVLHHGFVSPTPEMSFDVNSAADCHPSALGI